MGEKDNGGWNALMHASFHRNLGVVQYFVEEGCDVQKQNNNGENALTLSMSLHTYFGLVPLLLLEHGCKLQDEDQSGIFDIENRIQEIELINNSIKKLLPHVELVVINLISEFTNGLENLQTAGNLLAVD